MGFLCCCLEESGDSEWSFNGFWWTCGGGIELGLGVGVGVGA